MCSVWPGAAKPRAPKGTAASSPVPRGGMQKTTASEEVWTRSREVPTRDREIRPCGASLSGRAASAVSGDEIELFVQIMAKPREESVWLETTTEVVGRSSKITTTAWLKGKAAAAALCWPGKRSRGCKLDIPQLRLTAPTGLKWKTLRGAGGCAGGRNFPPPVVLWLQLTLWHVKQAGLGEAED